MIEFLIVITGIAFLFYVLFGGADYGAGVLELFKPKNLAKEYEYTINKAIGPVWEANHVWLILIVVILFIGFPRIYELMSIYLHIPILAVLVGIVLRGCAFTFRHYDAIQDARSQALYTRVFSLSSLWTPIWFGITLAALTRGSLTMNTVDYRESYIYSWLGIFPLFLGFFTLALFTFLASVFLIAEAPTPPLKKVFMKRAFISHMLLVLLGAGTLLAGFFEKVPFIFNFFYYPESLTAFVLATVSLAPFYWAFLKRRLILLRGFAIFQVVCIIVGWYFACDHAVLVTKEGESLTFYAVAAPYETLEQLTLALAVGVILIFPALGYLWKMVKVEGRA
jgi:cytochrome d ubiquinol oxidase subunit II